MLKKITPFLCAILINLGLFAQTTARIEPMFWWTGMKQTELQLMVYAKAVSATDVQLQYEGVEILKVEKAESPNYIFINLKIKPETKPGSFKINFIKDKKVIYSYNYELKKRENLRTLGNINTSDVIYQLMPDRFANGNVKNDNVVGYADKCDRKNPDSRHGGDIKGIVDHLDYIKNLGMTAIWVTPFDDNNMEKYSYHGYAITDFYKIDARYGSNEEYKNFVQACHQKGIKVIKDVILNHCGLEYYWMKDLPFKNWIHQFGEYTRSNFRASTIIDIHASEFDKSRMLSGWFDKNMPDMDQRNPFLAKFLIQNAIWWIENVGLDAIRVDTQPYSYKEFVAEWAAAIEAEYKDFFIVGEAWQSKASYVSNFQARAKNNAAFNSNFPSVFDFPLSFSITAGLCEEDTWDNGIVKVYESFVDDYLYGNPDKLVNFLDNHDVTRFYAAVGEKINRYKLGVTLLATVRGIPMVYYGTELLMTSIAKLGDGDKRKDYPGGWPGDSINVFESKGLTPEQNDAMKYLQNLLKWRATSTAVIDGKMMQFLPENNVYVYFRYTDKEVVMVVLNNNEQESRSLKTNRFNEIIGSHKSGFDVISGKNIEDISILEIPAKTAMVINLK